MSKAETEKVKQILRNSRKKLRYQIDQQEEKRSSYRQVSPETEKHEQDMVKYSIKGIDRESLKNEVLMNNSILGKQVPEFNNNVQNYLDSYEVYDFSKSKAKLKAKKEKKMQSSKSKKDRLKKLEEEIASLTKNVKTQVKENETYKQNVVDEFDTEWS